jgi:hypothetical protein
LFLYDQQHAFQIEIFLNRTPVAFDLKPARLFPASAGLMLPQASLH